MASFKLNDDRMLAWYTPDGEVEAVHRSIQLKQMTFLAAEAVTGLAKDKQILNIAEISKQGELFYLVKTDEAKCFGLYKVSASGDYTKISKTKKEKLKTLQVLFWNGLPDLSGGFFIYKLISLNLYNLYFCRSR